MVVMLCHFRLLHPHSMAVEGLLFHNYHRFFLLPVEELLCFLTIGLTHVFAGAGPKGAFADVVVA